MLSMDSGQMARQQIVKGLTVKLVVLPTYVNVGSEIGGQSKILEWKTSVIPTLSVQYATQLEVLIIEQEQECLGLEARVLSILSITSLAG